MKLKISNLLQKEYHLVHSIRHRIITVFNMASAGQNAFFQNATMAGLQNKYGAPRRSGASKPAFFQKTSAPAPLAGQHAPNKPSNLRHETSVDESSQQGLQELQAKYVEPQSGEKEDKAGASSTAGANTRVSSGENTSSNSFPADTKASEMNSLSRSFAVEAMLKQEIEALTAKMNALVPASNAAGENLSGHSPVPPQGNQPASSSSEQPAPAREGDARESKPVDEKQVTHPASHTGGTDAQALEASDTTIHTTTTPLLPPLYIRALAPYASHALPHRPFTMCSMTRFPKTFLTNELGGTEWSPGFFHESSKIATLTSRKHDTYYVLDRSSNPYLPASPGQHGAALTLFFREFDDPGHKYENVPLFVGLDGDDSKSDKYVYMGNYTQSRWSDRLDHDRVDERIPESVKMHWARILAAPSSRDEVDHRPAWLVESIMSHFWPKPCYDGKVAGGMDEGGDGASVEEVGRDMEDYFEELREWRKDARDRVDGLAVDTVMRAFKNVSIPSIGPPRRRGSNVLVSANGRATGGRGVPSRPTPLLGISRMRLFRPQFLLHAREPLPCHPSGRVFSSRRGG